MSEFKKIKTCSDAVLQWAVIENVWRKRTQCRMHTILHLQANRPNAEHHQPLEQRLTEASARRLFTHDNRAQLTMIADKYELFGTKNNRHHAFGLGRLGALVDEDTFELKFGQTRITSAHTCTTNNIRILSGRKFWINNLSTWFKYQNTTIYSQQIRFAFSFEHTISFLVRWRKFSSLIFQLLQLLKLRFTSFIRK